MCQPWRKLIVLIQVRALCLVFLLVFCFLFLISPGGALSDSSFFETLESRHKSFMERLKEGVKGPADAHYYWLNGLNIVSPEKTFRLNVRCRMMYDVAYADLSNDYKRAYSDRDGFHTDIRQLRVWGWGTFNDNLEFKVDLDFANVRDVKDNWFRFKRTPYLRRFSFGHIKEPFSLEALTSSGSITFMEKALPSDAFGSGRNIGIRYNIPSLDERKTLALGFFYNTSTLSNVDNPQDQISDANGYNVTGRITSLVRYEDFGQELLHLGLCYSYGYRDDDVKIGARPESYLVDKRLVETDEFPAEEQHRFVTELASVSGPLSFQGEYFHAFTDSDTEGDLEFWGYYMFGSYFITGEHREYNTSRGVFAGVIPKNYFKLRENKWGAWEVALRHSYVDLNDNDITGGEERNFTLGLNWYTTSKTRVMFNYVHARVDQRSASSLEDGYLNIFQTRFQIIF